MLPADDPTLPSKAVAFQVTPAIANMDGLKKAVRPDLLPYQAAQLKVFAHAATGVWVEVPEDALLVPNDKATAYHVVVGS